MRFGTWNERCMGPESGKTFPNDRVGMVNSSGSTVR